MKMNVKVFNSLVDEPMVVQDVDGETLPIYSMDQTPHHKQFVSRGRLSAWTSDGKSFKLIVDKGFFEASGKFFDAHVNAIWVRLLREAGKINGKMMKTILLPVFLVLLAVSIVGFIVWPTHAQTIMLVSIILLFVAQMYQSRKVNKTFEAMQVSSQNEIFAYLGEDEVNEIVKRQNEYMAAYFNIEEDPVLEDEQVEVDQLEEADVVSDEAFAGIDLNEVEQLEELAGEDVEVTPQNLNDSEEE